MLELEHEEFKKMFLFCGVINCKLQGSHLFIYISQGKVGNMHCIVVALWLFVCLC
jgi:hypothetical protein